MYAFIYHNVGKTVLRKRDTCGIVKFHNSGTRDSPKKATDDMFEQTNSLLLDELINHVAEHSAYSVEALVGLTDVREARIVKQNFLYDEYRNGFAELRAGLHDAQAKRDNFRSEQEVDNLRGIILNKCADDTKRCESEILERSTFGRRVKERI